MSGDGLGMDREAFEERMRLWTPLKAALMAKLGALGAARWLEYAARQIRREHNLPAEERRP